MGGMRMKSRHESELVGFEERKGKEGTLYISYMIP